MTRAQRTVWADQLDVTKCKRASPVVHEHGALAYVTEGRVTFEQGERYELRAGDAVLVPAGRPHRRLAAIGARMWGVGFCMPCYATTELAPLLEPFERTRAGGSAVVTIPGARHEHFAYLLAELARERNALAQKSLLALVLTEVARAAPTSSATSPPSVVADALRFVERNCLRSISLADVAAALGLSASYLATTVKRATGKTVGAWIVAGRIAEARSRLLHGDERIDAIATRVGYADVTHFIRQFRRASGVTPAAYRAAHRSSPAPR